MGMLRTLARRLFKGLVAFIIALGLSVPISTAKGFVDPKAIGVFAFIFAGILALLSRSVPRKYKFITSAIMFAGIGFLKEAALPDLPRTEKAIAAEANRVLVQVAQTLGTPKEVKCRDPFLDPATGEAAKFFLMSDGRFVCYDRAGTIEGEDVRPFTKDLAYVAMRQRPPASKPAAPKLPPIMVVEAPVLQPELPIVRINEDAAALDPQRQQVVAIPDLAPAVRIIPCDQSTAAQQRCKEL